MKKRACLSLFCLYNGLMLSAHADDNGDVFELSLEELMRVPVTGATLTAESLRHVPSAVTVFSREQIQRLGVLYVEELMDYVPGFQRYRGANNTMNDMYSSRGRRIGTASSEVLIMIDGVQWGMPRTGAAAPLGPIPVYNVERVEFIRGPGSAIYGSNAMMGIINVINTTQLKTVAVGMGRYDRRFIELTLTQALDDWQLSLQARREQDNGQRFAIPDSFTAETLTSYDPRDLDDVSLRLTNADWQIDWRYTSRASHDFYSLELIGSEADSAFRTRLNQLRAQYDFRYGDVSSHLIVYAGDDYQLSIGQLGGPGQFAAISTPSSNDAPVGRVAFDAQSSGIKWQNDWNIDAARFQYGFEWRQVKNEDTLAASNFDLGELARREFPIHYYGELRATTLVEKQTRQQNTAVYLQYKTAVNDNGELMLGARWDHYTDIGSHLSPRLAYVHTIGEQHTVKLLYGEAFRAPSIAEKELINNPVQLGNPDLDPETVRSSELIWQSDWKNTVLSIGYFDNRFEDSIVLQPMGQLLIYENGKQDPSKGWEFEISHQWNNKWMTRYTHFYLTDKPANAYREADQMQSIIIEYQQEDWLGSLRGVYHGEREMATQGNEANRITLSDQLLINGNLTYRISSSLDLSFSVLNLQDRFHSGPFQTTTRNEGVPNRGREWLAEIEYQW